MGLEYEFEELSPADIARWNELIAPFPNRELFHHEPWLKHLATSRGIDIRRWAIHAERRIVGYFAAGLVRKGPFRILGSPLKSWCTNFMGPVVNGTFSGPSFVRALDELAKRERLSMTEIEYRGLTDSDYRAAGYEEVEGWTYLVPLTPGDPDKTFQVLESICRNRVRKAIKAGLTVEDTDDPAVADDYYDQYCDLMKRKGLVPPYGRECPWDLVRHLKKADLLFALRVRDKDGHVLATGLFPHDDRTVYFWGGASWQQGRELCPNELLHWKAMAMAAERGLTTYNMCGFGRFKKKFGGELITLRRWHKCYGLSARWARSAYAFYFRNQMRVRGWLKNRSLTEGEGD